MKENLRENRGLKYYIFLVIMIVLIFQDFLQKIIPSFKYFDEILSLMVLPFAVINLVKNKGNYKIKKYNLIIITCLIILCLMGFVSSAKYKYQSTNIVLSDFLVMIKFFMAYFLAELFSKDNEEIINKKVLKYTKIIILFLFLLTILNYIFNIWGGEIRWGIKSNKIFYSHQTAFVAVLIFLLAIIIRGENKIINKYTIFIMMMILSTLRMKALGFAILFLVISFYTEKSHKKISIKKIVILSLIILLCSYQQIKYYFITIDDSARAMLLKTSFTIANDYFPLGTGFGTFGSYYSSVEYSPIYAKYDLENIHGLQENNAIFISDSFWPMIIGQFGYIGIMLYVIIIFIIFMKIQKRYTKETKRIYMSRLICLLYLLISSTAESAFVNSFAIPLAIIMAI